MVALGQGEQMRAAVSNVFDVGEGSMWLLLVFRLGIVFGVV